MIRRVLVPIAVLGIIGYALLMVTYEIIGVDFVGFMEDQPSFDYQEGPRRLPPQGSVPLSRPRYLDDSQYLENPVPPDNVSLQRGEILYGFHCAVCHGQAGQGDGPVVQFWREDARPPAVLTEPRIAEYPDAALYRIITQGFGGMPPLRENLTERQRWDVINYVHTIPEG
jgi:mono/diheme cytochrome c family protein